MTCLGGLLVLLWLDQELPGRLPLARDLLLAMWVVLLARLTWRVIEWREDWFVVTDRRLLIRTGMVTRRVGDDAADQGDRHELRRDRRSAGRSATARSSSSPPARTRRCARSRHLPRPDGLYLEICELLFGPKAPVPGAARVAGLDYGRNASVAPLTIARSSSTTTAASTKMATPALRC